MSWPAMGANAFSPVTTATAAATPEDLSLNTKCRLPWEEFLLTREILSCSAGVTTAGGHGKSFQKPEIFQEIPNPDEVEVGRNGGAPFPPLPGFSRAQLNLPLQWYGSPLSMMGPTVRVDTVLFLSIYTASYCGDWSFAASLPNPSDRRRTVGNVV